MGFLTVFILLGCGQTPEEKIVFDKTRSDNVVRVSALNQKSLDNPVLVGRTKSGKTVTMATVGFICPTCDGGRPEEHYIYMVDGVTTNNYSYQSGKTTVHKTEVMLSDNPTAEEIIAEAERLKKSVIDSDNVDTKP